MILLIENYKEIIYKILIIANTLPPWNVHQETNPSIEHEKERITYPFIKFLVKGQKRP